MFCSSQTFDDRRALPTQIGALNLSFPSTDSFLHNFHRSVIESPLVSISLSHEWVGPTVCRVTNWSWFAQDFPSFRTENPTSWESLHSWAHWDSWSPSVP